MCIRVPRPVGVSISISALMRFSNNHSLALTATPAQTAANVLALRSCWWAASSAAVVMSAMGSAAHCQTTFMYGKSTKEGDASGVGNFAQQQDQRSSFASCFDAGWLLALEDLGRSLVETFALRSLKRKFVFAGAATALYSTGKREDNGLIAGTLRRS